ncbi:hypothetical protein [Paractinoplanes durhamensis]|uniref:Uncharacterized protein n=1 Tax=Paractinoplanes durhamensis TaxID=113563 RepID=A0ABQ3ZE80_9ACTN|nr:hypothetical protein [Actinoplanes durhamensis]GIE08143.1 hypothetical protein Adu01nite_94930 [Actinoplanes durhamensis]
MRNIKVVIAAGLTALCTLSVGVPASADSGTTTPSTATASAAPPVSADDGSRATLSPVPTNGKTAEQLLQQLSRPMSDAKAAAAAAQSERYSAGPAAFPDAVYGPNQMNPEMLFDLKTGLKGITNT